MADLNPLSISDKVLALARPPSAARAAAARYIRRACADADLILTMLDLEET